MQSKLVSVVGVAIVACSLSMALAQSKKEPVFVESEKAEFKEVAPGVKKKILWGNHDAAAYGAFTKFDPGLTNPLHTIPTKSVSSCCGAPTFISPRTATRGELVPGPISPFRPVPCT
jgi:hypothetical protein